jgi:hypothetical protein
MKKLWLHFCIILGLSVAILFLFFKGLESYTHKDQAIKVPSFIGLNEKEVLEKIDDRFSIQFSDSIYDKSKPRGVVLFQHPLPESEVKQGRRLYLTLNARTPKPKPIPDIVDKSIGYGIASLQKEGFKIGRIDTVKDEFPVILHLVYFGNELRKTSHIPEESVIDLVVGTGK